mgnify:CR=1 FL=1
MESDAIDFNFIAAIRKKPRVVRGFAQPESRIELVHIGFHILITAVRHNKFNNRPDIVSASLENNAG